MDSENTNAILANWIQKQQLTPPQVDFLESLQKLPVLGLQLSVTPDLLEKARQHLQNSNSREDPSSSFAYNNYSAKPTPKDFFIQHTRIKTKAENFPISSLKIGSWERVTRNEGDLVAKCYFAKRKLVWEFLENGLKRKIEIQWNDISSLKVSKQENQSAILEIELNIPPSFHHEIDPQPRKHTQWRIVSDFTGGQARCFRRHWLKFSPGVLDKPLEKLLKHDNRLFQLIQQGFPAHNSPYFDFSFDFGEKGYINLEHQQQNQISFSNVPANAHMTQNYSNMNVSHPPLPVMPLWDQRMNNVGDGDHRDDQNCINPMPGWGQVGMNAVGDDHQDCPSDYAQIWGQEMNNASDNIAKNQVRGMPFATSSDFPMIGSMNQLLGLNSTLRNMTLSNSQIDIFSDGFAMNNMTTDYEPPNTIDSVQSQLPYENIPMNIVSGNNMFYPSINSDPTTQYFSSFKAQ